MENLSDYQLALNRMDSDSLRIALEGELLEKLLESKDPKVSEAIRQLWNGTPIIKTTDGTPDILIKLKGVKSRVQLAKAIEEAGVDSTSPEFQQLYEKYGKGLPLVTEPETPMAGIHQQMFTK